MPETHGEPLEDTHGGQASNDVKRGSPLTPSVRRHLGGALRAAYAAGPTEPPGERIEALLNRLGNTHPDGATD